MWKDTWVTTKIMAQIIHTIKFKRPVFQMRNKKIHGRTFWVEKAGGRIGTSLGFLVMWRDNLLLKRIQIVTKGHHKGIGNKDPEYIFESDLIELCDPM